MTTPLLVPQLGNEITEAEVAEWLVGDGETVAEGDPVVMISTTKTSMELEAPASGTLTIVLEEGEIGEIGATLATIA